MSTLPNCARPNRANKSTMSWKMNIFRSFLCLICVEHAWNISGGDTRVGYTRRVPPAWGGDMAWQRRRGRNPIGYLFSATLAPSVTAAVRRREGEATDSRLTQRQG